CAREGGSSAWGNNRLDVW
nr:immunoglobulin heavy chain junction region [Macaca mulatta]MOW48952.1 immunoglobulin heavy chain junction region [Macaca mulatta]MOW49362.1 immunoglobulin heavy chain junction region [Macaca mulatta]MOW49551.1 immunoglobulin heavy chain junction region [Macaca mulatta]MOW50072.1 immunoglobulin heavy chain junction region [Macaca mulatta]